MQEFLLRFEHLPGKDNPVADALSRDVMETTKKEFPNTGILDKFEKPCKSTPASANPVILQRKKELHECTTPDCEAYARGNPQQLCQGCWAVKYEKRRSELLATAPATTWSTAAKDISGMKIP